MVLGSVKGKKCFMDFSKSMPFWDMWLRQNFRYNLQLKCIMVYYNVPF